MSDESEHI